MHRPDITNGALLKTNHHLRIMRNPDKPIYFSPDNYGIAETTSVMNTVLDICTVTTTYSGLKRKLKAIYGEYQEEELKTALVSMYTGGFLSVDGNTEKQTIEPYDENISMGIDSVYIHITDRCNYSCVYCANEKDRQGMSTELTYEEWTKSIDQISEMGTKQVIFTGGEPLLRKDLFRIANYGRSKGLKTAVITNASLITERNVKDVSEAFDGIAISIDSHLPSVADTLRGDGAYDTAVRAIELLGGEGKHCSINLVLTGINIDSFRETAEFFIETFGNIDKINPMMQEMDELCPEYAVSSGQIEEYAETVLSMSIDAKERGYSYIGDDAYWIGHRPICGAGRTTIAVGPDGIVYPCTVLYTKEMACGNLLETPLRELYVSNEIINMVRASDSDRSRSCVNENCPYYFYCNGGCLGISYHKTGELKAWASKRQCFMYQLLSVNRIVLNAMDA